MKKFVLAIVVLLVVAGLADWVVVERVPVNPLEFGTPPGCDGPGKNG